MDKPFRDAGDLLAHALDDIRKGAFQMEKGIIRLRTGECIRRVVRDVDFMLLSNGRQYAHCTYNTQEITIYRNRDANGNGTGEWFPLADPDETSEERLERQVQAHLEASARHRDDPMF